MAPELKDMILQIARAHQVPSTMDGAQGCHGEMFNHSGQENPKMLPEMSEESLRNEKGITFSIFHTGD